MEGLHAFGDILTKISVNCVINLHVALLFTCLFLWVFPLCGLYMSLYLWEFPIFVACICYYYFHMNMCI